MPTIDPESIQIGIMHTLTDICAELAYLPAMTALANRLPQAGATWLRVAPLVSAARTPVVAALASRHLFPILYVVGSPEQALRAAEDVRQWIAPEHVRLYPASDALPYEHMSTSADLVRERLHTLHTLAQRPADDATPLVLVAPLKALLQPTLTPPELLAATTMIRQGEWLSQDTLLRRWIDLGYRMSPAVESPGDLNRRGGLVDVWPSADMLPLRIEWFGDEIDSLRRFDPQTQRSEARLEQATVGPPGDIPLWRRAEALASIARLDLSGLRREAHDDWNERVARLEAGAYFEGLDFFAPFFRAETTRPAHTPPGSILGYLPIRALVMFDEALLLHQSAQAIHDHAEEQRCNLIEGGELPASFPRPYLLWHELGLDADWQQDASGMPVLIDMSNNELDGPELAVTSTRTMQLPAPLFGAADLFGGKLRQLIQTIVTRLGQHERVVVVTPQAARLQELVTEALASNQYAATETSDRPEQTDNLASRFYAIHGSLEQGWQMPELGLSLYTDTEIFGQRQRRPLARQRRRQQSANERAAFLRGLKDGDYVVHIEHGIAIYDGLLRRTIGGVEREYLNLQYAAGDRLYVPVDQVDRVARYVGAGDARPQLTRLGTQEWERAKRKARAAVQDLANDLLDLYARRQLSQGFAFSQDNEWQRDLEWAFPYIETNDQLRVLAEVKHDMEQSQPMDRLICGDVGFGKTEVALRAAFKAVQSGKQVALLVPTTVLAQQHFDTFKQRMEPFAVMVEMLSRFRSAREQDVILQGLARGSVDMVIGTHRLLSKDVHFKDLGLVIVDEEQRFGVRHKERLKQLRAHVDVLTLTATPIPRTLHMSLAGIRDLSVIDTPPEDRVPIKTYVLPYEDTLVREAILREIEREGQVYFVHNRVFSIYHIATRLRQLVPEANIGVAHGQLDERQLEKAMLDFFSGAYNVLICTTIIESGLDVPNANTIIIDDATNYGLAQLYQLRGRVGRSTNRAYAYLLYKRDAILSEEAKQRLQAIQEATELGAGFRIAMRDLEIRGAGNLLGAEQSGHIAAVGFDLYSRLLEQVVSQLKKRLKDQPRESDGSQPEQPLTQIDRSPPIVNEKVLVSPLVTLDLPLTAYLPEAYIADDAVRLGVYQHMAEALTPEDVRLLRQELRDRFGDLPEPAAHLLTWLRIKALALQAGVTSVVTTDEEFIIRLPIVRETERDRMRRRFGRDTSVKVGPQFIRMDRRLLSDTWMEKLENVLEVLGKD